MKEVMSIPQRKDRVSIPNCILHGNKQIKSAFLRGLADADFCLTIKRSKKYPVVQGTSKSRTLMKQCSNILSELGLKNNIYYETVYCKKRKARYFRHSMSNKNLVECLPPVIDMVA